MSKFIIVEADSYEKVNDEINKYVKNDGYVKHGLMHVNLKKKYEFKHNWEGHPPICTSGEEFVYTQALIKEIRQTDTINNNSEVLQIGADRAKLFCEGVNTYIEQGWALYEPMQVTVVNKSVCNSKRDLYEVRTTENILDYSQLITK